MKMLKLILEDNTKIETTMDEMTLMSPKELMKLTKGKRILNHEFFEESGQ